jgi:hypothetical protein
MKRGAIWGEFPASQVPRIRAMWRFPFSMVSMMADRRRRRAVDPKVELRGPWRSVKDWIVPPVIIPAMLSLALIIFLLLRGPI